MVTDLVQIQRLGEQKLKENERFRKHMKVHDFPEKRFRRIAEEVEDATDCRSCANCCKVAETNLNERDIERLAKVFSMKPKQFIDEYTTTSAQEEDEEEEIILRRNDGGCILLEGNDCSVYESRPDTCRNFPHLMRGAGSLQSRMWLMGDRATYCPIVYNTLEQYKDMMSFKR